jgi:arsenate reductase (glutaredoxin)
MKFRIYHNPRCRKSRAGLEYLSSRTEDYVTVDYLKLGLNREDIREMLLKLHIRPKDLIRTNEDLYKKELKSKNFNDEEWIQIIIENPRLIRRPVIVGKLKAVVGDPVNNIEKLFL